MSMLTSTFTNRQIYDSIRMRRRSLTHRGMCPVAEKAIFANCESNQLVVLLASKNFGLRPQSTFQCAPRTGNHAKNLCRVQGSAGWVYSGCNTPHPCPLAPAGAVELD